jgi:UPF0716 protein FxsA
MTQTEKQTARRLPLGRILLIAFVIMPLIEIAVLIRVGSWIGLWPTLALIILTAIAGTWMLKRQGFAVLARAQDQLNRGAVPVAEVFEGFCLVIAGALLLTPGFVTDLTGAALLLPPVRAWLYRQLGHHLKVATVGGAGQPPPGPRPPGSPPPGNKPDGPAPVIEGEFDEVDPESQAPDPGKPPPEDDMPPPRGSWSNQP